MERVRIIDPIECITKRELAKKLSVNPWTIDRWRQKGLIPEPIKLSSQVLVWRRQTIERWLSEREADHG